MPGLNFYSVAAFTVSFLYLAFNFLTMMLLGGDVSVFILLRDCLFS